MRLVLDTNIFISAIIFGGNPRKVRETVISKKNRLLTSNAILDELVVVLTSDKFQFSVENAERIRQALRNIAEVIRPDQRLDVVKRDPSDNRIIECAVSGGADCIVTGDKDLLVLKSYRGISILTPTEFLERDRG